MQPDDTFVVAWLDRFRRHFDESARTQAGLTEENIGIVASKEGINTSGDSAMAKVLRKMTLAQQAYQLQSSSERIRRAWNGRGPKVECQDSPRPSCPNRCRSAGAYTRRAPL